MSKYLYRETQELGLFMTHGIFRNFVIQFYKDDLNSRLPFQCLGEKDSISMGKVDVNECKNKSDLTYLIIFK